MKKIKELKAGFDAFIDQKIIPVQGKVKVMVCALAWLLPALGYTYFLHMPKQQEMDRLLQTKKGLIKEAMRECKSAVSLQKNFPEAYHNLGLCYETAGMTEDALRCYESALRINPKLAFTHIQIGKIFLKKGLKDKALEHFKAALKEEPQDRKSVV